MLRAGLGLSRAANRAQRRAGEGRADKDRAPAEFRRACRAYAEKFLDSQREDFKRLGILGDWDAPYITMAPAIRRPSCARSASSLRAGSSTRARSRSIGACEIAPPWPKRKSSTRRTSPSIYVEFPLSPDDAGLLSERVPALKGRDVTTLIWTTTPWTIPSNLAVAFHPEFDYGAYEIAGAGAPAGRDSRRGAGRSRRGGDRPPLGAKLASFRGDAVERLRFRHPLYDRDSLAVLAQYVTLEQGTGVVHTAPGHGADDFATGVRYGLDIYAPIGNNGRFNDDVGVVGGLKVFEANPVVVAALEQAGGSGLRRVSSIRIRTAGVVISR